MRPEQPAQSSPEGGLEGAATNQIMYGVNRISSTPVVR